MLVPPPWRRRALRVLHALGLDAGRVGPTALVVGRRSRTDIHRLGAGAVLAADRAALRDNWFAAEKALTSVLAHGHVAALLRMYRVNCVLDVGANRGQYAQRLRAAGYDGHIFSFEPVPATHEELRRAAEHDPRWTALPYALGREDGTTEINVVPGTLSSVLRPTRFGARRYEQLRDARTERVPARRLDRLLDELLAGVPDARPYLKLDTQGYDLEVFAGLGDRAGELVGLQSEVALLTIYEGMPRMPEAVRTYEDAGFEITALYPVSRQSRTARVLEFDCVMVRPGAV